VVAERIIESIRFSESLRLRSFLHSEADIGLHLHGAFELVVILRGSLLWQTDRESRLLSAGDVGLAHCWQPHGTQRVGEANRILVLQIDPGLAAADPDFQRRRFTLPPRPDVPLQSHLASLVARLHLDGLQRRNGWALRQESQALALLGMLLDQCDSEVLQSSEQLFSQNDYPEIGAALRRAMDFIWANYQLPISLADVAAAQRSSANYLSRLFRAQAKTSFSTFLTQLRLVRAADRLKAAPRATILSVALDVGFPNIAAFNTAFRRAFGATPSKWRKAAVSAQGPASAFYLGAGDHEDIDILSDLAARLPDAIQTG
jgi:AraC-like DNA-binding protein